MGGGCFCNLISEATLHYLDTCSHLVLGSPWLGWQRWVTVADQRDATEWMPTATNPSLKKTLSVPTVGHFPMRVGFLIQRREAWV